MDRLTRTILGCYATAATLALLIVPWKGCFERSYSFMFSPPCFEASVDYEVLVLELMSLTSICAIVYLYRDQISRSVNRTGTYLLEEKVEEDGVPTSRLSKVFFFFTLFLVLAIVRECKH